MGNLIKFCTYLDVNKSKNKKINMIAIKRSFKDYDKWLERNNRDDVAKNYEKFLINNYKVR